MTYINLPMMKGLEVSKLRALSRRIAMISPPRSARRTEAVARLCGGCAVVAVLALAACDSGVDGNRQIGKQIEKAGRLDRKS